MTCDGDSDCPANVTCAVFARCLFVPAINCCARADTEALPFDFVAMGLSLLSEGGAKQDAANPSEPECPAGSARRFSRPSYGHSRAEGRFRAAGKKIDRLRQ